MSSDIKAFLYGWGILISFLVIRYFYRESQAKKNRPKVSPQEIANRVSAIMAMKNKKSQTNLFFKSTDTALEYIEKFFSNFVLEERGLYYGKILHLDKAKTFGYAKVLCLIDNKAGYALVSVIKGRECKSELAKGDLVYVGIKEVNNIIAYKESFNLANFKKNKNVNNTVGSIVKKMTLELNPQNSQFEFAD